MSLAQKLKGKLRDLPDKPGCYLMRDRYGNIIYIGKAASLRKRVIYYFRQATRIGADPKLRGLIKSICDLDVIISRSEAEAVLTEAELIRKYRPRYNIAFKDDKRFLLLRVNLNEPYPRFTLCRFKRNDAAVYFGPYASSRAARSALEFIDKYFRLRKCSVRIPGKQEHKHCINDIVRFCSAPCIGKVSRAQYRQHVDQACAFLAGQMPAVFKEVQDLIKEAAKKLDFEKAAGLRDSLRYLQKVVKQKAHIARKSGLSAEEAMAGIKGIRNILKLSHLPRMIEAYDVSTISGTYAVASLVVAENGVPKPSCYRRFRIKTVKTTNDPKMLAEAVRRRITRLKEENRAMPDLILADGGITQLRAVKSALKRLGVCKVPVAALAKRFEDIYWQKNGKFRILHFKRNFPALKVFQSIRDEAHRFALTYHRRLREKRIRESLLDDIPGIGKKRKEQLLRRFQSVRQIQKADENVIAGIPGIGSNLAHIIKISLTGNISKCIR